MGMFPNPAKREPNREGGDLTRRRGGAEEDAEKLERKNKPEGRSGTRPFLGAGAEEAEVAEGKS